MADDTFAAVLKHLQNEAETVRIAPLYNLSHLTADNAVKFEQTWPTLSPARRRKVIERLVEITEDSFEVNFDSVFIMALGDADADVQTWAIKGLWENASPQLVQPFLYLLKQGKTPAVRAAAATALGQYVYLGEIEELAAEIQELVEQALLETIRRAQEDVEVVRRAVESIAFSSREGIETIIESAYYHEQEPMRISAIFAMGRSFNPKWENIIISELDSNSPAVRYEAARACGELSLKSAVGRLIRLIQEESDPEVQFNAIWALGQIGGKQAEEMLHTLIESGDDETVKMEAQDALDELTMFQSGALMFDFGEDASDDDLLAWDDDEFDMDDDELETFNLN